MSKLMEQGAPISKRIRRAAATTGALPEALVSSKPGLRTSWDPVIDELLRWQGHALELFDADDAPSPDAIETAIDFAQDSRDVGQPAPLSITPTGAGCITFQWRDGQDAVTIEILGTGAAEVTELSSGRISRQFPIERDPLTRKIQLSV